MADNSSDSSNEQWPGRSDEPDLQHTAPITSEEADTAAQATAPPEPTPESWQEQYQKERRRSRILMGTTAVAGALFAGSLFYAVAQTNTVTPAGFNGPGQGFQGGPGQGQGGPGMGRGGSGWGDGDGYGGPGMMRGQVPMGGFVEHFFNSDGSLNEDLAAQFKQELQDRGTAFEQQLQAEIAREVAKGDITQKQADELSAALGLSSSSNTT